jgi:hypothetical protein
MKTLITLILLLIASLSYSQKYTVVQINAGWNSKHNVDLPYKIEGANVIFGYLEEQATSLQKSVKAVPVVIVYKDNKPIMQWTADLSFNLNLTKEEIADVIRKNKQTYQRAGSN